MTPGVAARLAARQDAAQTGFGTQHEVDKVALGVILRTARAALVVRNSDRRLRLAIDMTTSGFVSRIKPKIKDALCAPIVLPFQLNFPYPDFPTYPVHSQHLESPYSPPPDHSDLPSSKSVQAVTDRSNPLSRAYSLSLFKQILRFFFPVKQNYPVSTA